VEVADLPGDVGIHVGHEERELARGVHVEPPKRCQVLLEKLA
jgi:hypothetical protein